jgi:hypothetical protein
MSLMTKMTLLRNRTMEDFITPQEQQPGQRTD